MSKTDLIHRILKNNDLNNTEKDFENTADFMSSEALENFGKCEHKYLIKDGLI